MPAAVAIGIGAAAGGYSAYKGSREQSKAASRAAKSSNALQRYMYDQTREDQAPWREIGGEALDQLWAELSGDPGHRLRSQLAAEESRLQELQALQKEPAPHSPGDGGFHGLANKLNQQVWNKRQGELTAEIAQAKERITGLQSQLDSPEMARRPGGFQFDPTEDPGYQFRLNQGENAIRRAMSASGYLGSGKELKDLTRFNQNLASQEYGNAFNRWGTRMNQLAGIAGVGQTATARTGAAGQSAANAITNTNMAVGQIQGNAAASAYQGIGSSINSGINNMMFYQMMNRPAAGANAITPYMSTPQLGGNAINRYGSIA